MSKRTVIVVGVILVGLMMGPAVSTAQQERSLTPFADVQAAPQRTPSQVEVVNFPVDEAGDLRVTSSAGALEIQVVYTQADRDGNGFGPFPPIAMPAGFSRVSVGVGAIFPEARINSVQVGFGSASWPPPDQQAARFTPIANTIQGFPSFGGNHGQGTFQVGDYFIGGSLMFITVSASDGPTGTMLPPPTTRYFVHLYLTR